MSIFSRWSRKHRIARQAARWVVRQQVGLTPADTDRLRHWQDRDPRHRAALQEAADLWSWMNDSGHLTALPPVPSPRRGWTGWQVGLAALPILILLAVWINPWRPALSTSAAEQRQIALEDGSQLWLGPDSTADIRFDAEQRRIVLHDGQAYVIAAPRTLTEPRPLVIEAAGPSGPVTVRALGTRFNVNILPDGVDVAVEEHQVRVTAPSLPNPITLETGQMLFHDSKAIPTVRKIDPIRIADWRQSLLVANHRPLRDVVAELDRYRHGRTLITDEALAERVVSGVFDMRNPDAALQTVTTVLQTRSLTILPGLTIIY